MTSEEAIASLKVLCHTCKFFPTCVNDKPECFRAIEMAIKSLEAWGKVKEEIKQIRIHCGYLDVQGVTIIEVLEIIDKHLAEMSE